MNVPEINEVKTILSDLKEKGLISDWELPYENLLTRRSAAIFFLEPSKERKTHIAEVWSKLQRFDNFSFRLNTEKKLSQMVFRMTFSKEEAEKNKKVELYNSVEQ